MTSVFFSPKDTKENIEKWISIFPDVKINVITLVSDREYVSTFYTIGGSNEDYLMGIKPTKKFIEINVMSMYKIERGKICEEWISTDVFDNVLKQVTKSDKSAYKLSTSNY
jgi:predicted ester cyclase